MNSFCVSMSYDEYQKITQKYSKEYNISRLFDDSEYNTFLNWIINKIRSENRIHILNPQVECPPSFENKCREYYSSFCQRNQNRKQNHETYSIFKMIVHANKMFSLNDLISGKIKYVDYNPSIIKRIHDENVENGTHNQIILNLLMSIPKNQLPSRLPNFNPSVKLINASLDRFIARNHSVIFPDDIKARWYAFEYASYHYCLDHFTTLQSFINTDFRFGGCCRSYGFNNVWNTSQLPNQKTHHQTLNQFDTHLTVV